MNKKLSWMAKISIVAALYVALTLLCYPFSFGLIQVRLSEALILLVLYDKRYTIALTFGCLIANLFSLSLAGGVIDLILGPAATLISCLIMIYLKNKIIASLIPALINGLLIGLELVIMYEYPFYVASLSVAAGELIAVLGVGNAIFYLVDKNEYLVEKIKN